MTMKFNWIFHFFYYDSDHLAKEDIGIIEELDFIEEEVVEPVEKIKKTKKNKKKTVESATGSAKTTKNVEVK